MSGNDNLNNISDFENKVNNQISKAVKEIKKVENYTPSMELDLKIRTLYKIGDVVKTPKGKLEITDVRLTINCAIYEHNPDLDFLDKSTDNHSKYKIEKDIAVYYKFKNEVDTSNIFFTEAQLKRFYEEGIEPLTTQKILASFDKPVIKKRSIFKRIFGK